MTFSVPALRFSCLILLISVGVVNSAGADPSKERRHLNEMKAAAPQFRDSIEGIGLGLIQIGQSSRTTDLYLLGPQIAVTLVNVDRERLFNPPVDLKDIEVYFRAKDGQIEVGVVEKVSCSQLVPGLGTHACIVGLASELKKVTPLRMQGPKKVIYPLNLLVLERAIARVWSSPIHSIQDLLRTRVLNYGIERAEDYPLIIERDNARAYFSLVQKTPNQRIPVSSILESGGISYGSNDSRVMAEIMAHWNERFENLKKYMLDTFRYDLNSRKLVVSRGYIPFDSDQDFLTLLDLENGTEVYRHIDYPTQYFQESGREGFETVPDNVLAFTYDTDPSDQTKHFNWFGFNLLSFIQNFDEAEEGPNGKWLHFFYRTADLIPLVVDFQNKYGYDGGFTQGTATVSDSKRTKAQAAKNKKGNLGKSKQKRKECQPEATDEPKLLSLDHVEFESQSQPEDLTSKASDSQGQPQFPFLRKWYAGLTIKNKGNGILPYSEVFYIFIRDEQTCHYRVGLPNLDAIMGTHYLNKMPCTLDPETETLTFNYIDPKDDKIRVRLSLKWNSSRQIFEETKKPKKRTALELKPLKNDRLLETFTWQEVYGTTYQSPLRSVKLKEQVFQLSPNKPILSTLSGGWQLRYEAEETSALDSVHQNQKVGPSTLEIKCGPEKVTKDCAAIWQGVPGTVVLREGYFLEDFPLANQYWTLHVSFPTESHQLPITFLVYLDPSTGRVLLGRPSKWARLGKTRKMTRPGVFFEKVF